jgi:hypothetical protein
VTGRRLVDVALGATALAAVVSLARQRAEARAVASGRAPRTRAAAAIAPATRADPVGERLARWVPQRPRTPVGRAVSRVWVGPLTAAGFLLAALGRSRARWDEELGCYVARGVRGPSAGALRAVGAQANTVGQVVLARTPDPSPALLAHEAVHVRQGERLGPLLLVAYVWLGARYGYRDHPLERAARLGARLAMDGR